MRRSISSITRLRLKKARSRGKLGTNSFMRLRKRFGDSIEINDLGDAEND